MYLHKNKWTLSNDLIKWTTSHKWEKVGVCPGLLFAMVWGTV